jgi:hypothetical protein
MASSGASAWIKRHNPSFTSSSLRTLMSALALTALSGPHLAAELAAGAALFSFLDLLMRRSGAGTDGNIAWEEMAQGPPETGGRCPVIANNRRSSWQRKFPTLN